MGFSVYIKWRITVRQSINFVKHLYKSALPLSLSPLGDSALSNVVSYGVETHTSQIVHMDIGADLSMHEQICYMIINVKVAPR